MIATGSGALYLDTSAVVKLFRAETESRALESFLGNHQRLLSSALVVTEALRTTTRASDVSGALAAMARNVLMRLDLQAVSGDLLEQAGTLPPPLLRSLDAIHLATALSARQHLAGVVSYDDRLVSAARYHGLAVFAPGR